MEYLKSNLVDMLKSYQDAKRNKKEIPGEALIKMLECRLDNIVYRLGFANSIRQARQMVGNHGHFLVNGKKSEIYLLIELK